MLPLAGMLFNVVSGLVMDKAQSLAKEHVEKMIDDVLPEEAKAELNDIVKNDPEHPFESATDALMAAAEKKLPIPMKDGKVSPQDGSWWIRTIKDIEPDEEITWTYTLYNPIKPLIP
jgi:hypothetical protein